MAPSFRGALYARRSGLSTNTRAGVPSLDGHRTGIRLRKFQDTLDHRVLVRSDTNRAHAAGLWRRRDGKVISAESIELSASGRKKKSKPHGAAILGEQQAPVVMRLSNVQAPLDQALRVLLEYG